MKVGIMFPGYGSQFVGMGKELYDQSRIMQEFFEEASSCLNQNFVKLCFASSDMELSKIDHAYPALFLLNCALYTLLENAGVQPMIVAGYNQGEYAALFASRSINFPDGLYLLSKYAHLFQEQAVYASDMVLVCVEQLDVTVVNKIPIPLTVVAYNSYQSNVILLQAADIAAIERWVTDYTGTIQVLDYGFGFHNPSMMPVAQGLKMYLEKVDFKKPGIKVVSNTTGQILTQGEHIKTQILNQIIEPIDWVAVMKQFDLCDLIITIGPESLLYRWLKYQYRDKLILSFHTLHDLHVIQNLVGT